MVMSMTVAIIIIAVIFFRFVFFRLAVFYVVQCAKCVYQGLPPVFFELFLTESFIVSFNPNWKTKMKSLMAW